MKPLHSVFLSLLLVTATQAGANAQPATNNINPALLYYQAFLVAPELPQADSDLLWTNEWRGQQLPDRFGQIVGAYDYEFSLVRAAPRSAGPCDWGLDMSKGPSILLPYLARAKSTLLTAQFRALWDFQQGRQAEARQDLLASLALGRNVARDGLLVSCLVQQAMEMIFSREVAEDFGRFSKDNLQQLLDGMDAGPARWMVANCAATEGAFFRNWALGKIQELQQANPGDDAKVMAGIRDLLANALEPEAAIQEPQPSQFPMFTSKDAVQANSASIGETATGDWWTKLSQAAGGTSTGVVQLIQGLGPFNSKLAAVLSLQAGECTTQMVQFKAELQQSPNPLPLLLLPPWEHRRERELRALADLAMVRAAIQYELNGQAGLESVVDPWTGRPFPIQRFVFQGVDRGFMLTSAYPGNSWPESTIFVEKDGTPFYVDGKLVGQPRPSSYPK